MSAINFLAMMMTANLTRSAQAIAMPQARYVEAVAVSSEYQDAQDFYYFCPKDGQPDPIVARKNISYNRSCWSQISLISDKAEVVLAKKSAIVGFSFFSPGKTSSEKEADLRTKADYQANRSIEQSWHNTEYQKLVLI